MGRTSPTSCASIRAVARFTRASRTCRRVFTRAAIPSSSTSIRARYSSWASIAGLRSPHCSCAWARSRQAAREPRRARSTVSAISAVRLGSVVRALPPAVSSSSSSRGATAGQGRRPLRIGSAVVGSPRTRSNSRPTADRSRYNWWPAPQYHRLRASRRLVRTVQLIGPGGKVAAAADQGLVVGESGDWTDWTDWTDTVDRIDTVGEEAHRPRSDPASPSGIRAHPATESIHGKSRSPVVLTTAGRRDGGPVRHRQARER